MLRAASRGFAVRGRRDVLFDVTRRALLFLALVKARLGVTRRHPPAWLARRALVRWARLAVWARSRFALPDRGRPRSVSGIAGGGVRFLVAAGAGAGPGFMRAGTRQRGTERRRSDTRRTRWHRAMRLGRPGSSGCFSASARMAFTCSDKSGSGKYQSGPGMARKARRRRASSTAARPSRRRQRRKTAAIQWWRRRRGFGARRRAEALSRSVQMPAWAARRKWRWMVAVGPWSVEMRVQGVLVRQMRKMASRRPRGSLSGRPGPEVRAV